MIHQKVKKITAELETLVHYNISVARALDLIEASTKNLEELIAINTMRESLQELEAKDSRRLMTHPSLMPALPSSALMYHA